MESRKRTFIVPVILDRKPVMAWVVGQGATLLSIDGCNLLRSLLAKNTDVSTRIARILRIFLLASDPSCLLCSVEGTRLQGLLMPNFALFPEGLSDVSHKKLNATLQLRIPKVLCS
jgi:hypothetical protein